ncbi:hypothetical protein [Actinomyces massiliensis]|uniref:hypothetical protein n=1 Tax=Actinomyces massiliensis TaxID=461393 RepID=UPI0028ECD787|nr:hypothetical protein [Actinomyces massiliensis]
MTALDISPATLLRDDPGRAPHGPGQGDEALSDLLTRTVSAASQDWRQLLGVLITSEDGRNPNDVPRHGLGRWSATADAAAMVVATCALDADAALGVLEASMRSGMHPVAEEALRTARLGDLPEWGLETTGMQKRSTQARSNHLTGPAQGEATLIAVTDAASAVEAARRLPAQVQARHGLSPAQVQAWAKGYPRLLQASRRALHGTDTARDCLAQTMAHRLTAINMRNEFRSLIPADQRPLTQLRSLTAFLRQGGLDTAQTKAVAAAIIDHGPRLIVAWDRRVIQALDGGQWARMSGQPPPHPGNRHHAGTRHRPRPYSAAPRPARRRENRLPPRSHAHRPHPAGAHGPQGAQHQGHPPTKPSARRPRRRQQPLHTRHQAHPRPPDRPLIYTFPRLGSSGSGQG